MCFQFPMKKSFLYYIKAFVEETTDLGKFTAKDFPIGAAVFMFT